MLSKENKYYAARERAKIYGYLTGNNDAFDTAVFLCDEVERYRKKIEYLEEALEKSKSVTANEKRAAEGLPPISSEFCEELTAVSCGTREKQALEIAKKKMLEIYETLTPEECRAWEMGEVYAEIVRGLK